MQCVPVPPRSLLAITTARLNGLRNPSMNALPLTWLSQRLSRYSIPCVPTRDLLPCSNRWDLPRFKRIAKRGPPPARVTAILQGDVNTTAALIGTVFNDGLD